jgi:hypothetical protein
MVSSFNHWTAMMAEDAPSLTKNALRDEMEGSCVRGGMVYDKHARRLVGGRLV